MRRRVVAYGVIVAMLAMLAGAPGCATLKNTKVPQAFDDVGVCKHCNKLVALDGLADEETAICPECGATFTVRDARLGFKRKIVGRRNAKTAQSFLTVTWLAASVAATLYGIPIPPPILNEDSFSPYRAPLRITCRRAKRAAATPIIYNEIAIRNPSSYSELYIPAQFPNPYEMEQGPYSIVINDYDEGQDLPVKNAKLGKVSLYFQDKYDILFSPTGEELWQKYRPRKGDVMSGFQSIAR